MLENRQAVLPPITMASSPSHNFYASRAARTPETDTARSRHGSDAMDIYVITDQTPPESHQANTPPETHQANNERGNHNGSPSLMSTVSSKIPEPHDPFCEENGRTYHGYRKGMYMLPCDEQEQDRLDIFHKLFTVARVEESLMYAPHPHNGRFLDLGCGTGIWSIDVAHKYPNAFVAGVDLAPIQPSNHPPNCQFYAPFDYESNWALGEDSWDLIHLQMGSGSVVRWPTLYKKVLAHLRPGAWFEQVEIDFEPRCDDRSLDGLALRNWYSYLKQATRDCMRPIAHSSRLTIQELEEAGFTEIDHQMVGLPLNPWHQDNHESTVARWYNLAISESIETLSLAPFSRVYHWPLEKIRKIAAEVKSEAFNKEIHAYNILHIYQARKPMVH
ncbi:S-adenosyl-L-methionine-dependent methyltransferase [Aspergillus heteromorphus CBS 117.55]|uniref:Velvet complex subunit laeA n=1 Tax=Aspergillus heteromorphus CBS 117.55 TaxID=1448321 RepID=A0A317X0D3_9EURO|nr:S-adenosyl-L-methionine-dependent methyltransferase [Aspergillus heteromorphus CBS 117.55]PWY92013.1 S-adenosyl-L-methionine-dependent methyltransferase [Aspergillus heteromorphus CBS 117.55]